MGSNGKSWENSRIPDATYDKEKGVVKHCLRGRPIYYQVPTKVKASYNPQGKSQLPKASLKLEWVYGYRGRDCRNNLHYLAGSGEMVYFMAAVAVLHHVDENTQRFYIGHTDDIKCLSVHPDGTTIATGQTVGTNEDAKPHIRIWSSSNLETLHILGLDQFERQIVCLAFSQMDRGGVLAAVEDVRPSTKLSLWDWDVKQGQEKKIAESKASDEVLNICFSSEEDGCFVSSGKSNITFWNYKDNKLVKKLGALPLSDRPRYVSAVAYLPGGNILSGDSNGHLTIWKNDSGSYASLRRIEDAHIDGILSILVLDGGSVVTGGKDRFIKHWDSQFQQAKLQIEIPVEYGPARTIIQRGSQFLVGTTKNCILTGGCDESLNAIVRGHTDELWASACQPSTSNFVTADKLLCCWDAINHSLNWSCLLQEKAQSVCFSPSGDSVVVGTVSGLWVIIDSKTHETTTQHKDGDEPIQVMKFSPCGNYLALGSRDNFIYIYSFKNNNEYNKIGKLQGHSSYITHLDWSADSTFIQSNSGDYELLFWNALKCQQITSSSDMCEVEWATHTCVLSLVTLGIWPEGVDGTDINTCARSNNRTCLATGDDFGKVKLFAHPVIKQRAQCREYGGHCSHVTGVSFLNGDSHLISTGGKDAAVLQWAVDQGTSSVSV